MCLRKIFCGHPQPPVASKRMLLSFAINDYKNSGNDLNGCINDQKNLSAKLKELWPDIQIRTFQDNEVTKERFLSEVMDAFKDMPVGELMIHYSGHGTTINDVHGDELDGVDECLYVINGVITDDEMNILLSGKPTGLKISFLSDSCFSGSNTRAIETKARFLHYPGQNNTGKVRKRFASKTLTWITISGCKEDQTSSDAIIGGVWNGAYTYYAVKTLSKGMTFQTWCEATRYALNKARFEQVPTIEGPDNLLDSIVFE